MLYVYCIIVCTRTINIQAAAAVCCTSTTNDEYMQTVHAYFAARDDHFFP